MQGYNADTENKQVRLVKIMLIVTRLHIQGGAGEIDQDDFCALIFWHWSFREAVKQLETAYQKMTRWECLLLAEPVS